MKKTFFALTIVMLLLASVLLVGATDAPVIYVCEEAGNRMEVTLLDDTSCSLHVLFAEGGEATLTGAYTWENELLVLLQPDGEELGRFTVEGTVLTEYTASDGESTERPPTSIDYALLAKQLVTYIQSGEAPEELIDSVIAMGEQMQQMKEDGYTLQERLLQLISPENLLTTATAAFLIVGAIVLFILRKRQKDNELDIGDILSAVAAIQKKQEGESEDATTRSNASKQSQEEMIALLKQVLISVEQNANAAERAGNGSAAVAKMVKDVFLNSRTIDADGKQLMVRNYNEAVGKLSGGNDEQQNEADPM